MGGKAAIILVIGFGIILGRIAFNMNDMETKAVDNVSYYLENTIAHNLALAGANVALSMVYQDSTIRGIVTDPAQFTTGPFAGGKYTARMDSINPTLLRLRSVSTFIGLHDTVDVTFARGQWLPFTLFAWFTNVEGDIWWISKDTVWGRVHSNDTINISGTPVYWKKVTTARQFNPKPGVGTNHAQFKGGYETGVGVLPMPTDLSQIINASTSGGKRYTNEIWITLDPKTSANNNGKAYIRNSSFGPIVDSISLSNPSFNGVILGNQRVHVKGTLDGKLTIASLQDVYVEDNIYYEKNPQAGFSDDMLGLVSESNVVVADNSANNNNCEIDAAIFARTGSFTAENYRYRPVSGWLRLLGSITQNIRGAVGTFSGETIMSGFSKRYRYDDRYDNPDNRPPFFPGTFPPTLRIAGWWESFRLPRF
ncbi:MAG: hypothetical protein WBW16_02590 [Bacteroidota bacterium]